MSFNLVKEKGIYILSFMFAKCLPFQRSSCRSERHLVAFRASLADFLGNSSRLAGDIDNESISLLAHNFTNGSQAPC